MIEIWRVVLGLIRTQTSLRLPTMTLHLWNVGLKDKVRWSGTMTYLKTTLRNSYPNLTDDPYSFPRQENKLSAAIRHIQPPLRRMGVQLEFCRSGKSGERIIRIERA